MQQTRWEDLPRRERVKRTMIVCVASAAVLVFWFLRQPPPAAVSPLPQASSAPVQVKAPASPEARRVAWDEFAREAKMRLDFSDSLTMATTLVAQTSRSQVEIYRAMKDGYLKHAGVKNLPIPSALADDGEVVRMQGEVMKVMAVRAVAFQRGMEYFEGADVSAAAAMADRLERMKTKSQQTREALKQYAEALPR